MEPQSSYQPLFELGVICDNPAVKMLADADICPVTLAAVTIALFESVMRVVPESKQNEFEKIYKESFRSLMKERYNYDLLVYEPPAAENESEEE